MPAYALPPLSLRDWEPTYQTLHRWMQVVGKIRMVSSPPQNHWWHASLRFTARGLTTTPMVFGEREVEIRFDFIEHALVLETNDGLIRRLPLRPQSVADFYHAVLAEMRELGIPIHINPVPAEVPDPVPLDRDHSRAAYDRRCVEDMWKILSVVYGIFAQFRGEFLGKSSPVHFFWGAFDVAVTRFSGRPNPTPPADPVMREAYSHELISHGFWFGGDWPAGGRFEEPVFYAYAVPEPAGFARTQVPPMMAQYSDALHEFILPYEAVRVSSQPVSDVLEFMRATYETGARLGNWDRVSLERAA